MNIILGITSAVVAGVLGFIAGIYYIASKMFKGF